jgi:ribosomal protein S18 acetylase RimI-like enzyme
MGWTLRAGQPEEAEELLAFWVEAGAEPTHTDTRESLCVLMEHDPAALIMAEENGAIVGSVIAAWDGWRGSVYRLVVSRSHRRRGLGRQLLRAAEERLSSAGALRAQAIVVENEVVENEVVENEAVGDEAVALSFWRASGWQQQVRRLRFVKG